VVGDPAAAPGAVQPEHCRCGERVDGRQAGGIVKRELGKRAESVGGDRPEAEQRADCGPRLPGFAGPADVAEDLGVNGELERPHHADRRGGGGPRFGVPDHAGGSVAACRG
jgi:hypothetical protein